MAESGGVFYISGRAKAGIIVIFVLMLVIVLFPEQDKTAVLDAKTPAAAGDKEQSTMETLSKEKLKELIESSSSIQWPDLDEKSIPMPLRIKIRELQNTRRKQEQEKRKQEQEKKRHEKKRKEKNIMPI
jgi:hypothetical protein